MSMLLSFIFIYIYSCTFIPSFSKQSTQQPFYWFLHHKIIINAKTTETDLSVKLFIASHVITHHKLNIQFTDFQQLELNKFPISLFLLWHQMTSCHVTRGTQFQLHHFNGWIHRVRCEIKDWWFL